MPEPLLQTSKHLGEPAEKVENGYEWLTMVSWIRLANSLLNKHLIKPLVSNYLYVVKLVNLVD